jgi:hypothetical protein
VVRVDQVRNDVPGAARATRSRPRSRTGYRRSRGCARRVDEDQVKRLREQIAKEQLLLEWLAHLGQPPSACGTSGFPGSCGIGWPRFRR